MLTNWIEQMHAFAITNTTFVSFGVSKRSSSKKREPAFQPSTLETFITQLPEYSRGQAHAGGLYRIPSYLMTKVRKMVRDAGRVLVLFKEGKPRRQQFYVDPFPETLRLKLLERNLDATETALAISGDPQNKSRTGMELRHRWECQRRNDTNKMPPLHGRVSYQSLTPQQIQNSYTVLMAQNLALPWRMQNPSYSPIHSIDTQTGLINLQNQHGDITRIVVPFVLKPIVSEVIRYTPEKDQIRSKELGPAPLAFIAITRVDEFPIISSIMETTSNQDDSTPLEWFIRLNSSPPQRQRRYQIPLGLSK